MVGTGCVPIQPAGGVERQALSSAMALEKVAVINQPLRLKAFTRVQLPPAEIRRRYSESDRPCLR